MELLTCSAKATVSGLLIVQYKECGSNVKKLAALCCIIAPMTSSEGRAWRRKILQKLMRPSLDGIHMIQDETF